MSRIYGSKTNLANQDDEEILLFLDTIADLLCCEEVNRLKEFSQHLNTSRYQHSINVAYYTFKICRKFNLHTYEATRAALLHDLYFYDFHEEKRGYHPKSHALEAYNNAKKITYVTPRMKDAIVKHMWPLVLKGPMTKESWVVQGADKYAACIEFAAQSKYKIKKTRLVTGLSSIVSTYR